MSSSQTSLAKKTKVQKVTQCARERQACSGLTPLMRSERDFLCDSTNPQDPLPSRTRVHLAEPIHCQLLKQRTLVFSYNMNSYLNSLDSAPVLSLSWSWSWFLSCPGPGPGPGPGPVVVLVLVPVLSWSWSWSWSWRGHGHTHVRHVNIVPNSTPQLGWVGLLLSN